MGRVVGDGGGRLKAVKVAIGVAQTVLRGSGEDRTHTVGPLDSPAPVAEPGIPAPDGCTSVLVNLFSERHDLSGLSEPLRLVEVTGQDAGESIPRRSSADRTLNASIFRQPWLEPLGMCAVNTSMSSSSGTETVARAINSG